MADLATQVADMNASAKSLLTKYDSAFTKLKEASEAERVELQKIVDQAKKDIEQMLADGVIDEEAIKNIISNSTSKKALDSEKLGAKSLDEVVQYMIDNQPEPVSTVNKFDIFEDNSSLVLLQLNNNTDDVGGQFNATASDIVNFNNNGKLGACIFQNTEGTDGLYISNFEGVGDWSISEFIKTADAGNGTAWNTVLHNADFDDNTRLTISIQDRNKLYVYTKDGVPQSDVFTLDDKFHHIAFSKQGTNIKGYLDGNKVLDGSIKDVPLGVSSSSKINLTGNPWSGEYFKGYVDQIRIFNRALSEDEIKILSEEL